MTSCKRPPTDPNRQLKVIITAHERRGGIARKDSLQPIDIARIGMQKVASL